MKLAIVTRTFPPDVTSGRETVIHNLWQQAAQLDDVTLISGWRHSAYGLPKNCLLIDQSSGSQIINYARFFFSSASLVRRLSPDVVLSNAIELGPVPFPSVVIVHDLNFGKADSRRDSQLLRSAILRRRLRGFTHVVAVSQATANQLLAMGLSPSQISVVLNGVDLDKWQPLSTADDDKLTVVCPSRIVHGKGQHIIIEALHRLDETLLAQVKLVIVGYLEDAQYLERIKADAVDLPVEFHTNVDDIVPYYQSADLVIFPTIMVEGFGLTAAEAMACGKPVIHSDYPAIQEATGGVGVPIPVGDVEALTHAMTLLLNDRERRKNLGRAGRTYAETNYTLANVYRQYRQILKELVSG